MENDLTAQELEFIKFHGLTSGDIHDGRNERHSVRKSRAKAAGKFLVLRTPSSRCNCSHRLTTRHGHCVQCDTSKLSYAKRYSSEAVVYIAAGISSKIMKIGTTGDIEHRQAMLNSQHYGGHSDWEILYHVKFKQAGAVEDEAQRGLSRFSTSGVYLKDGREQTAKEMFSCKFKDALKSVSSAAKSLGLQSNSEAWLSPSAKNF